MCQRNTGQHTFLPAKALGSENKGNVQCCVWAVPVPRPGSLQAAADSNLPISSRKRFQVQFCFFGFPKGPGSCPPVCGCVPGRGRCHSGCPEPPSPAWLRDQQEGLAGDHNHWVQYLICLQQLIFNSLFCSAAGHSCLRNRKGLLREFFLLLLHRAEHSCGCADTQIQSSFSSSPGWVLQVSRSLQRHRGGTAGTKCCLGRCTT